MRRRQPVYCAGIIVDYIKQRRAGLLYGAAEEAAMDIRVKRAYEKPAKSDGVRVLVDRLWPRGIRKDEAGLDAWMKEIAPSNELRKWFNHDPGRWEEFEARYHRELEEHADLVGRLAALARKGRLTLVYGARDEERNNAAALKTYLEESAS